MKRAIITELIWLAAIFVTAMVFSQFLPGKSMLDINLPDTFSSDGVKSRQFLLMYYLFADFVVITASVYLIRAIYNRFRVIPTDYILLISVGLLVFFFNDILSVYSISLINRFATEPVHNSDPTVVTGLFYGSDDSYAAASGVLFAAVKIFLILLLAFTGYMIGRNKAKAVGAKV